MKYFIGKELDQNNTSDSVAFGTQQRYMALYNVYGLYMTKVPVQRECYTTNTCNQIE